jgi:hypothetical protein
MSRWYSVFGGSEPLSLCCRRPRPPRGSTGYPVRLAIPRTASRICCLPCGFGVSFGRAGEDASIGFVQASMDDSIS